jgi:tetratricopeptide (TPR) repeat protein
VLLCRRWIAGLLLGTLPASSFGSAAEPDPAAALEGAIAAAEGSLRKGDLVAAARLYREAVFEGWLLAGTLERLDRRHAEAREALQQAALFVSDTPQALQSLASAQLQMGEAGRAAEVLDALAKRDARDVESRRLLAKALAASGRLDQAVQTLDEALPSATGDPELVFLLAADYLWLRKVDTAERLFAQVIQARPIPQTHVLIGRTYRDAGELERARAALRAALSQDPSVRRAHYYLGMVTLADAALGPDRLEHALAEFREELKLSPQDALANDQLGLALLEAGRPAEALPPFETAVRTESRSLYAYHLGRCLLALDRPAEAATWSRRALELAREQGAGEAALEKIHYQLGLTLGRLGASAEAAAHFAEARRLAAHWKDVVRAGTGASADPPTSAVFAATDESSPLAGLPPPQRLELRRRVTAGLARAYFNLGVLQAQSQRASSAAERFSRAAAFFERAAQLEPDFPQVQSSLGIAHFNARQFDRSTGPLSRAVTANPADAGLKRMLATAWLNTETYDKTVELLKDDPERSTDGALQLAYGLALVKTNRGAEAEAVLTGLLDGQGDSAELRALLGEALAQQGRLAEAEEQFELARKARERQRGRKP